MGGVQSRYWNVRDKKKKNRVASGGMLITEQHNREKDFVDRESERSGIEPESRMSHHRVRVMRELTSLRVMFLGESA
jgi:hypothetical protein